MRTINKLLPLNEVISLINNKKCLLIAGNENLLTQLPVGNWIGGTTPYFMDVNGGCYNKNMLFVTDLNDYAVNFSIKEYSSGDISKIVSDRYTNGFSYILVPGLSGIHQKFANDVYNLRNLYDTPLVGWVSGIDLDELGKSTPKVINGASGKLSNNSIVVMHVQLKEDQYAKLEILNLFTQRDGDEITFNSDGFECKNCFVNGKEVSLAQYIASNKIDIQLPLVANYSGAMINISFQNIDVKEDKVQFYAPVRKGVTYKIARPVSNYVNEFNRLIPADTDSVAFSCNCILNYLYSELKGKKTGNLTGPITFGEIAYVLVNQTLVYLSIEK
jgi:hypothetical protein